MSPRTIILSGLVALASTVVLAADNSSAEPWAEAMARFRKIDETHPSQPGGVVFVGSSSIRLWNLKTSFPDWNALNRGFGGSQLADSVRNIELLVLKHRPKAVVLYAGDNDIWAGKSPQTVRDDFRAFATAIHKALPKTDIFYIAIKPSIARQSKANVMKHANSLIEQECQNRNSCHFVDVWSVMLDDSAPPREELLRDDNLHLSLAGYELWTKAVREAFAHAGLEMKEMK